MIFALYFSYYFRPRTLISKALSYAYCRTKSLMVGFEADVQSGFDITVQYQIKLIIIRDTMPPKKKVNTGKAADEVDQAPKPAVEEEKKQPKEIKQVKETKQPAKQVSSVSDAKKDELKQELASEKISKKQSEGPKKINLADTPALSEAEILERRRLRFNLVGTQVDPEEAQRLKKQRLEKFGAKLPESKEELQKRKIKFGLKTNLLADQNQQTLLKRKQKFGGSGGADLSEDPKVLEERKKKFATNDVNLDDQIQKSKQKTRHQRPHDHKRNHPKQHHSRDRFDQQNKKFKR